MLLRYLPMNRFPPATLAGSRSGFTLIEMLVVISIIAVLAGLLLPVYNKVMYASRKVQVVNDIRQVRTACIAFYNDYQQKYPLPNRVANSGADTNGGNDTVYGDPGPNAFYSTADLFDILRATDISKHHFNSGDQENPSRTVYWNGQLAANLIQPRNGISQADVTWKDHVGSTYTIPKGSLMDPWGRSYIIWMDATRDGDLSVAASWFYIDRSSTVGTTPTGLPPMGIAMASMGADGFWGTVTRAKPYGDGILTGSDDVVLWR